MIKFVSQTSHFGLLEDSLKEKRLQATRQGLILVNEDRKAGGLKNSSLYILIDY